MRDWTLGMWVRRLSIKRRRRDVAGVVLKITIQFIVGMRIGGVDHDLVSYSSEKNNVAIDSNKALSLFKYGYAQKGLSRLKENRYERS